MPVERERNLRMVVESTVTERVDDGFNRVIKGAAKQSFQDNGDTCSPPVSPSSPSADSIIPVRVKKRDPVEVLQLHREPQVDAEVGHRGVQRCHGEVSHERGREDSGLQVFLNR